MKDGFQGTGRRLPGTGRRGHCPRNQKPLERIGNGGFSDFNWKGKELTPDHQHLLMLLTDAVARADASVSGLLNYAAPAHAQSGACPPGSVIPKDSGALPIPVDGIEDFG